MLLSSCAPAKYKGWSGGGEFFKDDIDKIPTTKPKPEPSVVKKQCSRLYIVQRGDTLSGIAQKCSIKMADLVAFNNLSKPYRIFPRQELKLYSPKNLIEKRPIKSKNNFIWPLKNRSNYKFIADIKGKTSLIITAPKGTRVHAVAKGEVVYAGEGINQFGKMVILKHANNYLTLYAHNDKIMVRKGQIVTQNEIIATVGSSGNVMESQLFFEVRHKGKKVDAKANFK